MPCDPLCWRWAPSHHPAGVKGHAPGLHCAVARSAFLFAFLFWMSCSEHVEGGPGPAVVFGGLRV